MNIHGKWEAWSRYTDNKLEKLILFTSHISSLIIKSILNQDKPKTNNLVQQYINSSGNLQVKL